MDQRSCSTPGCDKPHRARGLCSTHYNQANKRLVEIPCAECGKVTIKEPTSKYASRYCSLACRDAQRGLRSHTLDCSATWIPQLCRVPASHPVARMIAEDRTIARARNRHGACSRVFINDCSVCQSVFVSRYNAATCSEQCASAKERAGRSESRHRRRARLRDAFVSPVNRWSIYERDRYRCHICKRKVSLTKPVPHPRAATLDHLVPIATDGTHEPANVRTACFLCNSTKGARGGGEQLMLIG